MKKLLVWLSNTRLYSWMLIHVIPYIRFSMYYPRIRGNIYHDAYELLEVGDYILTKDKHKLTTLLIGGEWTHAALCVGKRVYGDLYEVAEMTHHNYTHSDFFDICKEADEIMIMRCVNFDSKYIRKVVAKCNSFHHATYDTAFKLGVKALYCSELVYQSDFERRLKVNLEDLAGLGRQYISPTGLAQAQNARVIYDSRGQKSKT